MAKAHLLTVLALALCTSLADGGRAADPSLKIVEFTADWCKPCQSMQPSMTKLARDGWQLSHVNVDHDAELVRTFQVKSVPTIVILRQGKEIDRIVGAMGYEKLLARFEAAAAAPATVRGQSPAPLAAFPLLNSAAMGSVSAAAPASAMAQPESARPESLRPAAVQPLTHQSVAHQPVAGRPVANRPGVREMTETPTTSLQLQPASTPRGPRAAASVEEAIAIARAATVRIRIDEANAVSYGTGTVINVHGNQALVLTCGHMFRDIKPDAKLSVDVYYNDQPVTLPAQLVSYDLKECDIGLMEFQMQQPIQPVRVAPLQEAPQIGDAAFSFGCDRGADPTRRDTQIKRINRYLGAANVEIQGAPVVGRSGGGLFDAQGRLIGVCNAADEEDDEGIYAALPVIHEHIAGLQLDELSTAGRLASAPAARVIPAQSIPPQSVAAQPVSVPRASGQLAAAGQGDLQMVPLRENAASDQAAGGGEYWPDQIAAASNASSAPQANASAGPAQLHCVVRDANGQESHITIDRPSEDLIATLKQYAQR